MDPRDRLFGELAVRLQLLSREQVVTCIEQQVLAPDKRLGEIAVALGLISAAEAELVATHQARVDARRTGAGLQAPVLETPRSAPVQPTAPATPSPAAPTPATPAAPVAGRRRGVQAWGAVDDPAKAQIRLPPASAVTPPASAPPVAPVATPPTPRAPADSPARLDMSIPPASTAPRMRPPSGRTATERLPTALDRPPVAPLPAAPAAVAAPVPAGPVSARTATPPAPAAAPVVTNAPAAAPPLKKPAARSGTLIAFAAPPLGAVAAATAPRPKLTPGDDLFTRAVQLAVEHHASDLHLLAGTPPHARMRGALVPLHDEPLTSDAVETVFAEIASAEQWSALEAHGSLELAYELPGIARLCVSAAHESGGLGLVCRVLPATPRSTVELGLPAQLETLVELPRGLVLCTGGVRSGKSSTWAALIGAALQRGNVHVATVEQPAAVAIAEGQGRVSRHALGSGTRTVASALRAALRQDADVLACDAPLDARALELLLAAAADRLVLATLPALHLGSALAQLSEVLAHRDVSLTNARIVRSVRAVIGQRLLACKRDASHRPAAELLVMTPAVAERLGQYGPRELTAAFQESRAAGSFTLDESIATLVSQGAIDLDTAKSAVDRAESLGA